jgi:hypothetical protein
MTIFYFLLISASFTIGRDNSVNQAKICGKGVIDNYSVKSVAGIV